MTTLSDLLAYKAALQKAYYSGVKSVTHNGNTTVFQDMEKMKKAIDDLNTEIAAADGRKRPVAGLAKFSRGDS